MLLLLGITINAVAGVAAVIMVAVIVAIAAVASVGAFAGDVHIKGTVE